MTIGVSLIPTLLIVEDHPAQQVLVKFMANKFGYDVVIATNGEQAIQHVSSEQRRYAAILLDGRLPDMSGIDCAKRIREFELKLGRRTPIIAVTAEAMPGDKELMTI